MMLSHVAIEERLKMLRQDGKDKDWAHWRGHDEGCQQGQFSASGYVGYGLCTCGRGERKAEGPTLAPLEYALPSHPSMDRPLLEAVGDFDFWVIDEIDFSRLLGKMVVNRDDVDLVAGTHPDESVRMLSAALTRIHRRTSLGTALEEASG